MYADEIDFNAHNLQLYVLTKNKSKSKDHEWQKCSSNFCHSLGSPSFQHSHPCKGKILVGDRFSPINNIFDDITKRLHSLSALTLPSKEYYSRR